MPMKKNGLKKKNMGYMGGGGTMMPTAPVSSMYRKGGKSYMGGGKTMDSTMSYKDDVQKKFGGGGMIDQPAMKKNKMMGGGMSRGFLRQSLMSQPDLPLPRGKKRRGDI